MADDTAIIDNKYQETHGKMESSTAEFIQFNQALTANIDSA